jgi:hypothetical protein
MTSSPLVTTVTALITDTASHPHLYHSSSDSSTYFSGTLLPGKLSDHRTLSTAVVNPDSSEKYPRPPLQSFFEAPPPSAHPVYHRA